MTTTPVRRLLRAMPALLLVFIPLRIAGQSAQPVQQQATAVTWADEVLKAESYTQPPKELVDAVLAPRHLNITLVNLSPDKKWFLDEIGDGPVVMKTFSKPFHELGGVFVDYKANRARALTIRNNVGIQLVSAADGTTKAIQVPAGARVSNAAWSPDSNSKLETSVASTGVFVSCRDLPVARSAIQMWLASSVCARYATLVTFEV